MSGGVAGSTFAAPNADWVLFEMPMPEMRNPLAYFSAFVEAPWDALDGVEPGDALPIDGVAWDKATQAQYVLNPVIMFPPGSGPGNNVATINEEKKIFSLLINAQRFVPDSIIRIGLYGFIKTYYVIAGLGTDGPFNGSIFSSEFYGSVTQDFRGIGTTLTPALLNGAPEKLFINAAKSGGDIGHIRLASSFPTELGASPFEYLTGGLGDWDWSVEFNAVDLGGGVWEWAWSGNNTATFLGPAITAIAPTDAPNSYFIYPVSLAWDGTDASIQTTAFWPASAVVKTKTMHSINAQDGAGNVAAIVDPPVGAGGGEYALVNGFNQIQYYVPTWKFTDDREVPVYIAANATGLLWWSDKATHTTPAPDSSYTWETADYPDRPEMAEIGTAVISNADDADGAITPFNHFGQIRIGTLVIHRASGLMEFLPVVAAPIDGGTTGDGPDGDGTAPGRTANPELRTWTYSLDGHDYYVLRLGDSLTLVYDDASEQWMDWTDYDSLTWRAHCGINWTGAQLLADTYGSSIVAGDDAYGLLWFLDPNQPYDDAPGSGDPIIYFSRVTVGQVPMKGREVLPCYAAWLTTDMGDPAYLGAGVTLYSSDDAGVTWDNHGFVLVTPDENSPELSWYSLGQIGAPGRLFKIFDNGAITRIDGLEMNDPDDEK